MVMHYAACDDFVDTNQPGTAGENFTNRPDLALMIIVDHNIDNIHMDMLISLLLILLLIMIYAGKCILHF